jgi:serine protease Do
MQRISLVRGLWGASLAAALSFGFVGGQATSSALADVPAQAPSADRAEGLPDFSSIVSRYGPAVVNVSTVTEEQNEKGAEPPDHNGAEEQDPMFQFFRRFGIPVPQTPQEEGPRRSLGSGFIISPDGLILTNAHVVDDADQVTVKLTDRREFRAKVVGIDKPSDVAVLRINAKHLPTVVTGNPDQVRVGDWVLAIGSPFGFDNSATAGIVSAKSRSLPDENYVPFIQTDAAVNPGNSGGPLFNERGQVIGINSQIFTRSGGYQGLAFAIPIDVALKVKDQIVEHGKVTRGRMGVAIQDLDQSLAESFGLKSPAGALVSSVEHDSPADKAGVKPGDVILTLNGEQVESSSDLPPRVANLKPGTKALLGVWRDGAERNLTVTVGEFEENQAAAGREDLAGSKLGLAVRPLTSDDTQWSEARGGLLVIQSAGAAARAGIQPGDVILAVNGTPVKSADQFRSLTEKATGHVALLVQRGDTRIYVPVDLG